MLPTALKLSFTDVPIVDLAEDCARAHGDTNAFTILAQDPNGGLEIRNRAGAWAAVPPVPGTIVLNVWTDGIFSSTVHRVVHRSGKRRSSMPRDTPFVVGERKARSTANIVSGAITVPS